MGQYAKELFERLRDNRGVRLSAKAREVRKAKSKRDREEQQARALQQNSRREHYAPRLSKNDSAEWRNKEPKYTTQPAEK